MVVTRRNEVVYFGSGCLLELGRRHFLITAGHCADRFEKGYDLNLIISDKPPAIMPSVHKKGFRHDRGTILDYGYFEIEDAGMIEAKQKIFMTAGRLKVIPSVRLDRLEEAGVLAGFPTDIASRDKGGYEARLLASMLPLPGCGFSPKGQRPNPALGVNALLIPVSEKVLEGDTRDPTLTDLPKLQGSSGGGFWIPENLASSEWLTLRLVAIHVGVRPKEESPDGFRLLCEVMVGHHLRLIADDYPDLRDEIITSWPFLRDDEWAY